MYLRNAWYVAAWNSEIGPASLFSRRLLGEDLVFYRCEDGSVVGLRDRCCHRAAPLSKGQKEGDRIRCMYHGLLFDGRGKCVEVPGQERISDRMCVRTYPVVVRNDLVWIWMGVPALANPDDILVAHRPDHPGWRVGDEGYLRYASGVQLIVDNLLDFSHLGFVHNQSIGTRKQGNVRPEVNFDEASVNVRFSTLNSEPPSFAKLLGCEHEAVDRFNYYVWHLRGNIFVQDSVIAPVGDGYESTDPSTIKLHTFIGLTPCDETTAHYFWSTAHNDFHPAVRNLTPLLTEQVARAFEEDRAIIEAQQSVITSAPDEPMIAIAADGTLLRVRRMLDSLLISDGQQQGVM